MDYGQIESATTYNYMNSIQEVILDKGVYKLEVWGATGGAYTNGPAVTAFGGYSAGLMLLQNSQRVYVVTGGQGESAGVCTGTTGTGAAGGYNGGGKGGNGNGWSGGNGGGGATHIATATGVLSALSENRDSILIVAGGSGGNPPHAEETAGAGGGTQSLRMVHRYQEEHRILGMLLVKDKMQEQKVVMLVVEQKEMEVEEEVTMVVMHIWLAE